MAWFPLVVGNETTILETQLQTGQTGLLAFGTHALENFLPSLFIFRQ